MNRHHVIVLILFAAASLPVLSEDVDLQVIHRIKQEATDRLAATDNRFAVI